MVIVTFCFVTEEGHAFLRQVMVAFPTEDVCFNPHNGLRPLSSKYGAG
jgi:hypothetical protein